MSGSFFIFALRFKTLSMKKLFLFILLLPCLVQLGWSQEQQEKEDKIFLNYLLLQGKKKLRKQQCLRKEMIVILANTLLILEKQ